MKWIHWEFMGHITIENHTDDLEQELCGDFGEVYVLSQEEHEKEVLKLLNDGTAFEYNGA